MTPLLLKIHGEASPWGATPGAPTAPLKMDLEEALTTVLQELADRTMLLLSRPVK